MSDIDSANTQVASPGPSPESDSLAEQALANPDRALLETGSETITYGEMHARVDSVAQWLLDTAGGPGRRIGLQVSGTESLMVGALALLRAGMVPVPLDPTAPAPWVGRALDDAGSDLLLSDVAVASADIHCAIVHPCAVGAEPPPCGVTAPAPSIGSITYTSGSTGNPKGVVLPSPTRLLGIPTSYISGAATDLEPDDVRIAFLGYGSVGVMQNVVLMGVRIGATMVAYDIRSRGIHGLGSWLAENRIWSVLAVPTLLRHFLAAIPRQLRLPALRVVVLYGEAVTWGDVAALWPHVETSCLVLSLFGCTEAGVVSLMVTTPDMPAGTRRLPAGFPLEGVAVTIEDDQYRPVLGGEVGEIVAWTETGGRGYWNRPEETARVFGTSDDGRRFVRTGDLGRLRPDGLLEHIGRMDDMVKVSGHRVDLSEVEETLRTLPGVVDGAAVARTDAGGDLRIITYVVPDTGPKAKATALRADLAGRLPASAVPDRIVFVDELPKLANGKADRIALGGLPCP